MPPPSEPIGTRDIDSTPPATTNGCTPLITPIAAKSIACKPDPQNRFTVVAAHLDGPPRVEHRVAREVRALLARLRHAPHDHVVDVFWIEPRLLGEPLEHLRENALRMNARERALASLATSTR